MSLSSATRWGWHVLGSSTAVCRRWRPRTVSRWGAALVLFFLAWTARANGLALASCLACHGPNTAESSCVRCHTPGLREDRSILYGKARELKPRYTRQGLVRYLQAPQDRWHGQGAMFALTDAQLKTVRDFLNRNPNDPPPDPSRIEAGQKLFAQERCASCHTKMGPGPILQLGYPFLNASYFKKILSQGQGRMPAFPQLSSEAVQDLYAYISLSPRVVNEEPNILNLSLASGDKLYQRILGNFTESGCVHCHGNPLHSTTEVAKIFGSAPHIFFLSPHAVDERSRPALESGPNCEDSLLIDRLQKRRHEMKGQHAPERGMPLTGMPWSESSIRELRQWSRLGCPNGSGFLCTPCVSGRKKSSFGEISPKRVVDMGEPSRRERPTLEIGPE
ncbi:MAG TPA: c-type cytochrome [Oligoflexus sp.]|uniref:c-type cytochrome n=1 Tax=Oligoflexus sp. TaxID=1971216 RepID=UPI002D5DA88A|nr:c-type cytochrome [Oligoflexus sp.]HYX35884.1 c-type cytochrome [Oligoflexus sp.]